MGIVVGNFAINIINTVELKVTNSGYAKLDEKWMGVVVTPPYSRLYYIISGDPYIIVGDTKTYLKKNYMYLIPMGMSYKYNCETSMEQLYFHINLANINGYDMLSDCGDYIELSISETEIDELISLYRSHEILDALTLKQKLYCHVIRLLHSKKDFGVENKNYSDCVSRAISYIQKNLSIKLDLKLLAKQAFTSKSNLAKKFKSETGIPIGKYIDNLVLYQAEQLLQRSKMSVLQISEMFGFCDQFYFARKFKAEFGVTPRDYRKRTSHT